MNQSLTQTERHFTAGASLAAIGVKLRQVDLFGPIRKTVRIAQKTVKHTPIDKLQDAFISMLAGAHGLVEINTRLRSDSALQAAFGREPLCGAVGGAASPGCLYPRECEPNGTSPRQHLSTA